VGKTVKDFPEQIEPVFTPTVGLALTNTTAAVLETQLLMLVPEMEYAVVVNGVTVKFPPVIV